MMQSNVIESVMLLFFAKLHLRTRLSSSVLVLLTMSVQAQVFNSNVVITTETAKMIRENLDWLILMLGNPNADVLVRNHRQVAA